ncbi:MAG: hypothetical protein FWD76_04615, partial [Firmicutes bacterium]|nr:hypothetical protein [Bacillota bacterium]
MNKNKTKVKQNKKGLVGVATLALLAFFCVSVMVGCNKIPESSFDQPPEPARVTYGLQGGIGSNNKGELQMVFPVGIKVPTLEKLYSNNPINAPKKADYNIADYYWAVDNSGDTPKYDEKDKVDFSDLVTTETTDITLYVAWQHNLWFQIGYTEDNGDWKKVSNRDNQVVQEGETFRRGTVGPTRPGYKFVD